MNRQQRRALARQKNNGVTYADQLAYKRMAEAEIQKLARDKTVEVEANIRTQEMMWLMICSIADAYGFGPKRMTPFFASLDSNAAELNRMKQENGDEYAYEKLRRRAEQVSGIQIEYLYEKELEDYRREKGQL